MATATGRGATPLAQQYVTQLCKHFGHRLPTELGDGFGRINFPTGECQLTVEGEALVVSLNTPEVDNLPVLRDVIVRHLDRFAFRSPVEIVWAA